jgi:hypothetical protein
MSYSGKITQHFISDKGRCIYLKAHGKCRKEGKSRDTAEDVVRRIMENKKIVNRDGRADLN